jgi:hypothetical protein
MTGETGGKRTVAACRLETYAPKNRFLECLSNDKLPLGEARTFNDFSFPLWL